MCNYGIYDYDEEDEVKDDTDEILYECDNCKSKTKSLNLRDRFFVFCCVQCMIQFRRRYINQRKPNPKNYNKLNPNLRDFHPYVKDKSFKY